MVFFNTRKAFKYIYSNVGGQLN